MKNCRGDPRLIPYYPLWKRFYDTFPLGPSRQTRSITWLKARSNSFATDIAQTPFHQWLLPELAGGQRGGGQCHHSPAGQAEFCRLPGRPELHGAVVAAMVDISGHAAVAAEVLHSVATIDMRVDYLRLASGTELMAVATVVKSAARSASSMSASMTIRSGWSRSGGRRTSRWMF